MRVILEPGEVMPLNCAVCDLSYSPTSDISKCCLNNRIIPPEFMIDKEKDIRNPDCKIEDHYSVPVKVDISKYELVEGSKGSCDGCSFEKQNCAVYNHECSDFFIFRLKVETNGKDEGDPTKKPKCCAFCDHLKCQPDITHICDKTGLVVTQLYIYYGKQNPECPIKDEQ